MEPTIFLRGKHPEKGIEIALGPLDVDKQLQLIDKWINDQQITENLYINRPLTLQVEKEILNKLSSDDKRVYLVIYFCEEDKFIPIGIADLLLLDVEKSFELVIDGSSCFVYSFLDKQMNNMLTLFSLLKLRKGDQIGYTGSFIGEKQYWNKGIGTTMKAVLLYWAFSSKPYLKLISTEYFIDNIASKRMLENTFHAPVAVKKGFCYKRNSFLDVQIMELSRYVWKKNITFFKAYLA